MHRPPEPRGDHASLAERSPWIVTDQPSELLTETPVGVLHPARRGGRVTNAEMVVGRMTVKNRLIRCRTTDFDTGTVLIRLSDVIYVTTGKHTINETTVDTVLIRHLQPPSSVVTTALHVWDDRERDVFVDYVTRYYRKQKRELIGLELTDEQHELLVTLYSGINQFDITDVLSRPTEEIRSLFGPLREAGLVGQGGAGSMLTGRGFMYANELFEDDDAM
jgi:helix-turn-helix protein